MATNWWPRSPSTPEVVATAVVAMAVALPLALVGLSTVTGLEVDGRELFRQSRQFLGLLAAGSVVSVPYGLALGVATLPAAARTGLGYGSPEGTAEVGPRLAHVAGAVLYVALATVAAGYVLFTALGVVEPATVFGGPNAAPAAVLLLAGSGFVAAAFLAGQLYQYGDGGIVRRGRGSTVDGRIVAHALYALGLLPSPFAALLVADRLVTTADLFVFATVASW